MSLIIRSEQMSVLQSAAEESFVRRLTAYLLEDYAQTMVRLPDRESTVAALTAEELRSLVESSIARARRHQLSFESSIAAFSAMMFEVAPNFDEHRLSQILLNDQEVEPDARLDVLLDVLTDKNWETIRHDYDLNAWR